LENSLDITPTLIAAKENSRNNAEKRYGFVLVLGSAIVWSFGGALRPFISGNDDWAIIFWRSIWAALFLLGYMLIKEGRRGTVQLFIKMGWPGVSVAICFAIASTCFIIALAHTTVANILLMQSGTPLIAALLVWILFREKISLPTWAAIFFVILGVAVMISDSFSGKVSPIGDTLSLIITFVFACATVVTRRYAHVRMIPATSLGTLIAACVAGCLAGNLWVTLPDMGVLVVFGGLNLGLGLAFFANGARLIPPTFTALLGVAEPLLGPIWVWLIHNEIPTFRTVIGGLIVLIALLCHICWMIYIQKSVLVKKTPV
jgi:drug/metabolite transporter (DMT)-like permease